MGQTSKIFTALGAGALLLHYPGIFSRLSNDGNQSPALLLLNSRAPWLLTTDSTKERIQLTNLLHWQSDWLGASILGALAHRVIHPICFALT